MRNPCYLLIACIATILCLSRCGHPDVKARVFTPDVLPAFTAEIDITRDTVLHTPEGALIHIPANSLDAGGSAKVRLVIREALKMSDMIRARLLTTSDGQPLSSRGMIDIEPADGQTVRITKPLTISMPAHFLDTSMRLYKGVPGPDGNLNWTAPQPLSPPLVDTSFLSSRSIFYTNCASCHAIGNIVTGPSLAYIGERRSREWLYAFTRNNQLVLASGDRYANCIFNEYNKTPMNTFPGLTDKDFDNLYRFIDYESYRLHLPYPDDNLKRHADSCDAIEKANGTFDKRIRKFKERHKDIYNRYNRNSLVSNPPLDIPPASEQVSSGRPPIYYPFPVNDFGWYNVDALLHQCEGVISSELIVKFKIEYKDKIDLYLVIPSRYVVQRGHQLTTDGQYGFYTEDGQLPLPQGARCFILAIGMKDSIPLAGNASFTAGPKQTIDIDIHPSTKQQIDNYIRQMDLKSIPAEKIVTTPKPDTYDCDCGMSKY